MVLLMLWICGAPKIFAASSDYYTLPTGTLLKVECSNYLSSKTAAKGDVFAVTVTESVYRDEIELIPSGTTIYGKIVTAEKAEEHRKNGLLAIEFSDLKFSDGTRRRLNGDLAESVDYEDFLPPFQVIAYKNVKAIDGGRNVNLADSTIRFLSRFFETEPSELISAKDKMFAKGFEAEIARGTDFLVKINHRLTIPVSR